MTYLFSHRPKRYVMIADEPPAMAVIAAAVGVGPYSRKDAAPAMKIGTTMLPIFMFIALSLSLSNGLVNRRLRPLP